MPPPSQLAIATSSLKRLVKEEASYHKELQQQQKSVQELESDASEEPADEEGNREFQLKQEVCFWISFRLNAFYLLWIFLLQILVRHTNGCVIRRMNLLPSTLLLHRVKLSLVTAPSHGRDKGCLPKNQGTDLDGG